MDQSIKFDVYGRRMLVAPSDHGWAVYFLGMDGKRRPADDIVVPSDLTGSELETYLADLCHEWATPEFPEVHRLEP